VSFFRRAVLYAQIGKDWLRVRNVSTGKEIERNSTIPFSSDRLVVADFKTAEKELVHAVKEVAARQILWRPDVVIHQLNTNPEELSEVGERVLKELASFARKAVVYVGSPLTDREVEAWLRQA